MSSERITPCRVGRRTRTEAGKIDIGEPGLSPRGFLAGGVLYMRGYLLTNFPRLKMQKLSKQFPFNTLNSTSKMGSIEMTEITQVPEELLCKYIYACHILHYHGLVDAYGHISVRLSTSTFLMARYMAPALVASKKDLVVYKVEDGEAVAADAPRGTYCAPSSAR